MENEKKWPLEKNMNDKGLYLKLNRFWNLWKHKIGNHHYMEYHTRHKNIISTGDI